MSSSPVYTFAKWQVRAGEKESVLSLLSELAAQSVKEPGNIVYKVYQSNSDPNTILLYEGYKSEADQVEHRNAEYFQRIVLGQIVPKLEQREVILSTEISFS